VSARILTLRGRAGVECIDRLAIEIQEPDIDPGKIAVICFRWSKGDAGDVEIADLLLLSTAQQSNGYGHGAAS